MRAGRWTLAVAGLAILTLAACGSDRVPRLMHLTSESAGPDEFGILPPKSLALPDSLTVLPEPTPGGSNRTDPTPKEDAIAALGGNAEGGVRGDAGLLNQTGRYGRTAEIRTTLAAEDLAYRKRNRAKPLERLFGLNAYFRVYQKQSLDQEAELQRWRKKGVRNVSAPPPKTGK